MTFGELRRLGEEILKTLPSPRHEAEYLISGFLDLSPVELQLDPARRIPPDAAEKIAELFRRRARREPAQYLLGRAPFRELMLRVTPAVLIPRPETEVLVDFLLEKLPRGASVLDLGTGSGAIALSLAYERRDLKVTACDISPEALAVARSNASACKVNVTFCRSDLFSAFEGVSFDAVAANLPYVTEEEYPGLEKELFFEPKLALTAPDSGCALMEKSVRMLKGHLNPGGTAVFELSPPQAERIARTGEAEGFSAQILPDLTGRQRFTVLTRPRA